MSSFKQAAVTCAFILGLFIQLVPDTLEAQPGRRLGQAMAPGVRTDIAGSVLENADEIGLTPDQLESIEALRADTPRRVRERLESGWRSGGPVSLRRERTQHPCVPTCGSRLPSSERSSPWSRCANSGGSDRGPPVFVAGCRGGAAIDVTGRSGRGAGPGEIGEGVVGRIREMCRCPAPVRLFVRIGPEEQQAPDPRSGQPVDSRCARRADAACRRLRFSRQGPMRLARSSVRIPAKRSGRLVSALTNQ